MGALIHPYVLIVVLTFSAAYTLTEKVKGPVKIAIHGLVHIVTLGKK